MRVGCFCGHVSPVPDDCTYDLGGAQAAGRSRSRRQSEPDCAPGKRFPVPAASRLLCWNEILVGQAGGRSHCQRFQEAPAVIILRLLNRICPIWISDFASGTRSEEHTSELQSPYVI